jgi:hypothetical protein
MNFLNNFILYISSVPVPYTVLVSLVYVFRISWFFIYIPICNIICIWHLYMLVVHVPVDKRSPATYCPVYSTCDTWSIYVMSRPVRFLLPSFFYPFLKEIEAVPVKSAILSITVIFLYCASSRFFLSHTKHSIILRAKT